MALANISPEVDTFTALAKENITAGMFVKAGSDETFTASVTSAGVSSFAGNEIEVMKMDNSADDEFVVGIAQEDATSGNTITVMTKGLFILPAQAAVEAGLSISPSVATDAFANSVDVTIDTEEEFKIGKALTGTAASGQFLIAYVDI